MDTQRSERIVCSRSFFKSEKRLSKSRHCHISSVLEELMKEEQWGWRNGVLSTGLSSWGTSQAALLFCLWLRQRGMELSAAEAAPCSLLPDLARNLCVWLSACWQSTTTKIWCSMFVCFTVVEHLKKMACFYASVSIHKGETEFLNHQYLHFCWWASIK